LSGRVLQPGDDYADECEIGLDLALDALERTERDIARSPRT
jgi:hypothetical protein